MNHQQRKSMPHIQSKSSRPATAALGLVLASIALAACGGSSGSSTTATTSASATAPTTSTAKGARGPGSSRFTALRECLQKNGVTLPTRKAGAKPGAGGFRGGGFTLPKGVSKATYEAALKKCGGGFKPGNFAGGGAARFSSPQAKQALAKFAACLRENGVKVGEPNTSGKGPIFDTKGVNTKSPTFTAAEKKCSTDLRGAFGARPGGAGAGAPGTGAPGAGAAGAPPAEG
jgi:hypothetical protein